MKSKEQVWYSNPDIELPALSETRFISFPKDALIAAIKLLSKSAGQLLPHGKLESCDIRAEPEIAVSIGIRDENTGELRTRDFTAERLGAAMIAYCRQLNVPLPKTADKSLSVSGENVVLRVHVKATKLPPHG